SAFRRSTRFEPRISFHYLPSSQASASATAHRTVVGLKSALCPPATPHCPRSGLGGAVRDPFHRIRLQTQGRRRARLDDPIQGPSDDVGPASTHELAGDGNRGRKEARRTTTGHCAEERRSQGPRTGFPQIQKQEVASTGSVA